MRLNKWKSFLCICTSCTLLMSTAASANPAAITPLEESQVSSFQSGNQTSDQGWYRPRDRVRNPEVTERSFHLTGHPHPEALPRQEARPHQEALPPQGVLPRQEACPRQEALPLQGALLRPEARPHQESPPRQKALPYPEVRRRIRQPARLQGPLTRRPQLPCRSRR